MQALVKPLRLKITTFVQVVGIFVATMGTLSRKYAKY